MYIEYYTEGVDLSFIGVRIILSLFHITRVKFYLHATLIAITGNALSCWIFCYGKVIYWLCYHDMCPHLLHVFLSLVVCLKFGKGMVGI